MNTINLNATIKTKDHDGYKAQTVHEKMWILSKVQGDIVPCMTPDGPSDDFCWNITLTNWFTGSVYVLNTPVVGRIRSETYEDEETGYSEDVTWYENGRNRADALIEQMKKVGKLNMDNWTKQ